MLSGIFYLKLLFFINFINFLEVLINCGKFFFNEFFNVVLELINIIIILSDDRFRLLYLVFMLFILYLIEVKFEYEVCELIVLIYFFCVLNFL